MRDKYYVHLCLIAKHLQIYLKGQQNYTKLLDEDISRVLFQLFLYSLSRSVHIFSFYLPGTYIIFTICRTSQVILYIYDLYVIIVAIILLRCSEGRKSFVFKHNALIIDFIHVFQYQEEHVSHSQNIMMCVLYVIINITLHAWWISTCAIYIWSAQRFLRCPILSALDENCWFFDTVQVLFHVS